MLVEMFLTSRKQNSPKADNNFFCCLYHRDIQSPHEKPSIRELLLSVKRQNALIFEQCKRNKNQRMGTLVGH